MKIWLVSNMILEYISTCEPSNNAHKNFIQNPCAMSPFALSFDETWIKKIIDTY